MMECVEDVFHSMYDDTPCHRKPTASHTASQIDRQTVPPARHDHDASTAAGQIIGMCCVVASEGRADCLLA